VTGTAVAALADDSPPTVTDTTTATTSTETVPITPPPVDMAKVRAKRKAVAFHRAAAWRWETTSFSPLAKTRYAERHTTNIVRLDRLVKWWSSVHARAEQYTLHPPHFTDWMCIHAAIKNGHWNPRTLQYVGGGYPVSGTGEGSWTDPAPPYFGGLQMDYDFMRNYGYRFLVKKGTADHWTPLEQMWVGEQALKSGRGFYPWPWTARACGLI
jgi:hypothetical protein